MNSQNCLLLHVSNTYGHPHGCSSEQWQFKKGSVREKMFWVRNISSSNFEVCLNGWMDGFLINVFSSTVYLILWWFLWYWRIKPYGLGKMFYYWAVSPAPFPFFKILNHGLPKLPKHAEPFNSSLSINQIPWNAGFWHQAGDTGCAISLASTLSLTVPFCC